MRTIEQKARDIFDRYWLGELPVNPSYIAKSMGLRIVVDPSMVDVCKTELIADRSVQITVQSEAVSTGSRLVLAHALGHWVLGHLTPASPVLKDTPENFSSATIYANEREANQFAMALLMPAQMVPIAIKNGHSSVSSLSKLFFVSEVAAKTRLQHLRIL